jgi:hypothetical protein
LKCAIRPLAPLSIAPDGAALRRMEPPKSNQTRLINDAGGRTAGWPGERPRNPKYVRSIESNNQYD